MTETSMASKTLTLPAASASPPAAQIVEHADGLIGKEISTHDRSAPTSDQSWQVVPGWPEYEVSSHGCVRRIGCAKGARVGRTLRPSLNRITGYYSVCLSTHCRQKRIDVHRLVALAFLGAQPSDKHVVAHNDGVRTNNTAANLRWATQAENLGDCLRHDTACIGSRNPATHLTEVDVLAIRRMKGAGIPRPVIANGYGIHKRTVFAILAGTSWEHVK